LAGRQSAVVAGEAWVQIELGGRQVLVEAAGQRVDLGQDSLIKF